MRTSFVLPNQRRSPLTDTQNLKPGSKRKSLFRRDLALALPLTSLIDAFSIIVIYLLIGTQSSGMETKVPGQMNLPAAEHSISVNKVTPILKIQKGVYYIDDVKVASNQLVNKLDALKKESKDKDIELMIQADTEMKYSELDPIIKAGSLAGIEKLKFAVVPKQ
ncbi:MAG: ExbD/TolR family protein [Bdellovibrio sp.]